MQPGYNRPNCQFIKDMVLMSESPHSAITPKYDGFHIIADFSKNNTTHHLAELVSHGGVVMNGNNGGHTLEAIFRRLLKHTIRSIRPEILGIKAQRVRFEFVATGNDGGLHGLMSGEWAKSTTNPFEVRVFDAEWPVEAVMVVVASLLSSPSLSSLLLPPPPPPPPSPLPGPKYSERLAAIERAYPESMRVSRLDTLEAVVGYMRTGEGVVTHNSKTDKAYKVKAPRPLALRLIAARKGPGVVEAKLQNYIYTQFFFGCLRADSSTCLRAGENKNSDMVALCCMDYTDVMLKAEERKHECKTALNPKAILERNGVIGSFSKSCLAPTICRLLNLVKLGPLVKQRDMSEERVRFHEDGGHTIFTGKGRTFTIDEQCVFFAKPPRVTVSANDAWNNTRSGTIHLQAPTIMCFGHDEWTKFPDGRGIRYPLLRQLVAAHAFRDLTLFKTMARCKKDPLCELVTPVPPLVVNWVYPSANWYRPPPLVLLAVEDGAMVVNSVVNTAAIETKVCEDGSDHRRQLVDHGGDDLQQQPEDGNAKKRGCFYGLGNVSNKDV